MSVSDIFLTLLAFQSFSLAGFLILTRRGKRNSNLFLSAVLIVLGTHMTLNFIDTRIGYVLSWFTGTIGFLYGPLIWRFVGSIIYFSHKAKSTMLQFVPFLLALILAFYGTDSSLIGLFILAHFGIYMTVCFFMIKKHRLIVKNTTSVSQKYSLNWVTHFFLGVMVVFLIDVTRNLFGYMWSSVYDDALFALTIAILVFLLNILVFKSINHAEGFLGNTEEDEALVGEINKKYANSDLTKQEIKKLSDMFQALMITQRLYRNSELTLREFAKNVNTHPRIVSQVINQHYATNFSDWVNDFRIEHAKKLLANVTKKEMNITQILFDSGFNSKSSFYSIFLRKTGIKPKNLRDD